MAARAQLGSGKVSRHDDLPVNQVRFECARVSGAEQPVWPKFRKHRAGIRLGSGQPDPRVHHENFFEPKISQQPIAGPRSGRMPQRAPQPTALVGHGEGDDDHAAVHGPRPAASTNVVVSPEAVRYVAPPSVI
jgi:hypothetical protein